MGNFKIEIEAVGGHGTQRETLQGGSIDYSAAHPNDVDRLAKGFVDSYKQHANVISAKLIHWPDTTPIVDDLLTGVREHGDFAERWQGEEMLKFFAFHHLPEGAMRETSRMFCHLAFMLVRTVPRSPERTVALRKLLEGKDAAVRAAMKP